MPQSWPIHTLSEVPLRANIFMQQEMENEEIKKMRKKTGMNLFWELFFQASWWYWEKNAHLPKERESRTFEMTCRSVHLSSSLFTQLAHFWLVIGLRHGISANSEQRCCYNPRCKPYPLSNLLLLILFCFQLICFLEILLVEIGQGVEGGKVRIAKETSCPKINSTALLLHTLAFWIFTQHLCIFQELL